LRPSYYLNSKPEWFGNLPWPAFGPEQPGQASAYGIPAGNRSLNVALLGIPIVSPVVHPDINMTKAGFSSR